MSSIEKHEELAFTFNVDCLKMNTGNSVSSVSICVLFLPLLLFYLLFYSPFCSLFFCARQSAIFLRLCNYRYCWALRTFSISLLVWKLRFNIYNIDFDIISAFLLYFHVYSKCMDSLKSAKFITNTHWYNCCNYLIFNLIIVAYRALTFAYEFAL